MAAERGVEARVHPRVELGEVRTDAEPHVVARRIGGRDLDHAGREQSFDRRHSVHELRALSIVERFQEPAREVVAQPVDLGNLGVARRRATDDPHPTVGFERANGHETITLEAAQQAAEVSRVERQPRPQSAHIGSVRSDLPQQPRGAERSPASEVVIIEGTDPFGHGAIERAQLPHFVETHSLTLVRGLMSKLPERRQHCLESGLLSGNQFRGRRPSTDLDQDRRCAGHQRRPALAPAVLCDIRAHRHPSRVPPRLLERRTGGTDGADIAERLVNPDHEVRAQLLDERDQRPRLGLGQRRWAAVTGVPLPREVAVQIDSVGVAPQPRRHAIRVGDRDEPHLDIPINFGLQETTHHRGSRRLVAVQSPDHQHTPPGRGDESHEHLHVTTLHRLTDDGRQPTSG